MTTRAEEELRLETGRLERRLGAYESAVKRLMRPGADKEKINSDLDKDLDRANLWYDNQMPAFEAKWAPAEDHKVSEV